MPKRSLKGGVWPFDIFSNPKDPNAPQSVGWFRNPFKKTTPGVEASQAPALGAEATPAPAPAPAPTAVTQQDTPVSGGKRRTKRKSRSNKKKGKSRKQR